MKFLRKLFPTESRPSEPAGTALPVDSAPAPDNKDNGTMVKNVQIPESADGAEEHGSGEQEAAAAPSPEPSGDSATAEAVTPAADAEPAAESSEGETSPSAPGGTATRPLPELNEEAHAPDTVADTAPFMSDGSAANVVLATPEELPLPPAKATAPLPSTGELYSAFADNATRPLPETAFLDVTPLHHMVFGQVTDVGRIRSNNQDAMYSFFATGRGADGPPDFGLFVVADGMGGHQDGEKASALTTRTVTGRVLDSLYFPLVLGIGSVGDSPITEILAEAVQKANSEVMSHVPDGGTTCSVVATIGDRAYIAHVGDSRIYVFHHGILEKLTRDHSLVQRLIELDQITIDEAAEHPQKNVLYRALGQNESIEVDTMTKRLPSGGMLLLCSDGLWNQVTDAEITDIITRNHNPQEACQKLIMLANARGGIDNVTAILIHLPG